MYSYFLNFLKCVDPELAHRIAAVALKSGLGMFVPQRFHIHLGTTSMGLYFDTPLGIAAGFDKFADLVIPLYSLGFGHVEVGTVTLHPQPGNKKPRIHRVMSQKALINSMGFNNPGAQKMRENILKVRKSGRRLPIIGVNIGKSKVCPLEESAKDYVKSFELLADVSDYLVINVSSPNTEGLRTLQSVGNLNKILRSVKPIADRFKRPVLIKISPDLSNSDVTNIALLVKEFGLAGVVASNTTTKRTGLPNEFSSLHGGLSGPMLKERSLEMLKILRRDLPKNKFCIISVGGVWDYTDVLERLEYGADLVQGYTAFVYNGPYWASNINRDLSRLRS
ncbi:quinone-dependent dihydroorotate dehydrogenase [Tropheryma whipplei]|uniref:Dihydroorotate dehydrogenase (quinone) n=1 Tax=Tropheryma whipplei (strain Twist) TaxID=203267 RepID=Q83GM4_TROWT|nr:quinone-dependent dihydroorotate dehydrogenase [Tropheryma whipplei]AAO44335.1 dihydroorotate oxidase [Tropheryma whipplei str. Twist]